MASYYTILKVGDNYRDEWTNIGVAVFDDEGQFFDCRIAQNLERAQRRNDQWYDDWTPAYFRTWVGDMAPDVATLRKRQDTFAHCMSCVQLSDPAASLLTPEELLEDVYPRWVKE